MLLHRKINYVKQVSGHDFSVVEAVDTVSTMVGRYYGKLKQTYVIYEVKIKAQETERKQRTHSLETLIYNQLVFLAVDILLFDGFV